MPSVGPMELVVILAIALIVVGPKQLPKLAASVGASLREFRGGLAGASNSMKENVQAGTGESGRSAADETGKSRGA